MNKPALIIDDETTSVETLQRLLERYCPEVSVIGHELGVKSSLRTLEEKKPELVFLDIEMKDGTGFDLLEQLPDPAQFQVIFVTAYDQYAIKAFRYCALDYLLKPVDPDLLMKAVAKAISQTDQKLYDKIKVLKNNKNGQEKIILPSKDEFIVTDVEKIIRCEASGNYTSFHISGKHPQLVCKTLKEFDELLSGTRFIRVHKSHLINLEFVERYLPKESQVIMKDGSRVEISRRRKDVFLKHLFNQ